MKLKMWCLTSEARGGTEGKTLEGRRSINHGSKRGIACFEMPLPPPNDITLTTMAKGHTDRLGRRHRIRSPKGGKAREGAICGPDPLAPQRRSNCKRRRRMNLLTEQSTHHVRWTSLQSSMCRDIYSEYKPPVRHQTKSPRSWETSQSMSEGSVGCENECAKISRSKNKWQAVCSPRLTRLR